MTLADTNFAMHIHAQHSCSFTMFTFLKNNALYKQSRWDFDGFLSFFTIVRRVNISIVIMTVAHLFTNSMEYFIFLSVTAIKM